MYKAAVRWMIRRNIDRLNAGDHRPTLAMFAPNAVMSFPGDNSWSNQHRAPRTGTQPSLSHRGVDEIEAFLVRYVGTGMQMTVEDILVNGPPWNTRAAVRVHHWAPGADDTVAYQNRAVLMVTTSWGRIRTQEDYEDTVRVAAYDEILAAEGATEDRASAEAEDEAGEVGRRETVDAASARSAASA